MTLFVNGKFLAAPQTGVQVAAREFLTALDRSLSTLGGPETTLLVPEGTDVPALSAIAARTVRGPGRLPLWEQTALPRAARGGVLLNLANSGPVGFPANIVMFHDAQVWDTPASYSAAFRAWYRVLHPVLARRALRVLTVSAYSAGRLHAHGLGGSGGASVVPNGVDHILRHPPETLSGVPDERYFLSFASTQAHKNVALLRDVFARPESAGRPLVLVGRDPDGWSHQPNLHFTGRVRDGQLRTLYQNAQAFLFPSITEGFGLPPGEAMACGCPVVCSPGGALREIYEGAAIFADPHSPDEWSASLKELRQPARRDELTRRGLEHASELSWDKAGHRLRAVILDAMGGATRADAA